MGRLFFASKVHARRRRNRLHPGLIASAGKSHCPTACNTFAQPALGRGRPDSRAADNAQPGGYNRGVSSHAAGPAAFPAGPRPEIVMPTFTQTDRPLILTTPLGADKLLAVALSAREGVSELFHFEMECRAERGTAIDFGKLLGHKVSMKLEVPPKKARFFSGICSRVTQAETDRHFDHYQLEVVPQFWFLTKRAQSRIFQHVNVPDILKKVLTGLDMAFQIQGTFEPRDYCVQYRETDFNFACRLMEEEGIYYYFKHTAGGSQMIVANTPQSHSDLEPTSALRFKTLTQGAAIDEEAIFDLTKTQEVTSGKFTLHDHTFELPHKHLEADKPITDSIQVGKVSHTLKVGDNGKLEVYDWPGEYAQRFDGVNRSGGDQPAELQKIFTDNKRTVNLRMEAAATSAVVLNGASNLRHLTAGFKVTITAIDDVSKPLGADGPFVLTTVSHSARMGADFRSGSADSFTYNNTFTLMPAGVPFRPQRNTPKPVVAGTQTAVVVGPKGEEIFTDRFGRVKVQFHWDREGKNDADSSCWVRVTQPWAGKRWGAFFIPRIGQEIIVDFLEGDPDQPICVGCVYNADQTHPYLGDGPDTGNRANHKQDPKVMGVKSSTTPGGVGFNEWRFDDTKGKEQVWIHAEKDKDLRVKNDRRELILHDTHLIVGGKDKDGKKVGDQRELVYQDRHQTIHRNHVEQVMGNVQYMVGHGDADDGGNEDTVIEKDKKELIEKNSHLHVKENKDVLVDKIYNIVAGDLKVLINKDSQLHVKGDEKTKLDGTQSLTIGGDQKERIGGDASLQLGGDRKEKIGGAASLEVAGDQKERVGGAASLQVGGKQDIKVGQAFALEAGTTAYVKAGATLVLEAASQLSLKVGGNFIDISAAGVSIKGTMVLINSGGAAGSGTAPSPAPPDGPSPPDAPEDAEKAQDAVQAKPTKPDVADNALSGQKSAPS
jgi:type VI secretion system secreted protein VgrG